MLLGSVPSAYIKAMARVVEHYDGRMPDEIVDRHLAEVEIIIGQTPMDAARLARAPQLRAIINVKGNWEPVIDYAEAHRRGVQVLGPATSS